MAKKKKEPEVTRMESKREKVFKATEGVVPGVTEKVVVKAPIPGGMVKVMALVDYVGMNDIIYKGDVFLLPERRDKSLAFRGYVTEYDGEAPIVDKR